MSTSFTLDASATSLEAAQANQLASSTVMLERFNENLKTIYLQAFENWKISVLAGRIDNTNPPKPPAKYVLKDDGRGFIFPEIGTDPVCQMPEIPPDFSKTQEQIRAALAPNTIQIGNRIFGNWFQVGPRDTFPVGKTTPPTSSADGVTGTFEKFGAAVGPGWYLKTN